ncbi:MAG: hypothetical protein KAT86_05575 [Candidatus Latescibacteria bacterium]|nr:hypothetical protein [Candidatus Latescibacterota bacterium]
MNTSVVMNILTQDRLVLPDVLTSDTSDCANGWVIKATGFIRQTFSIAAPPDLEKHDMAIKGLDSSASMRVEAEWRKHLADQPRTVLGHRLQNIRAKIIASGQTLLSWDEIEHELSERRGEVRVGDEENYVR